MSNFLTPVDIGNRACQFCTEEIEEIFADAQEPLRETDQSADHDFSNIPHPRPFKGRYLTLALTPTPRPAGEARTQRMTPLSLRLRGRGI